MKTKELEKTVRDAVSKTVEDALGNATTAIAKLRQIHDLEEEIQQLNIEKGKREWEYEKKEMEIEHKVGLERKRQEFEVEQARREAVVTVKEENLTADKARFEENMKFIQDRFAEEVGYLKGIVEQVLTCVKEKGNGGGIEDK